MATVYHRDQPGAPALVYASNNAQAGFNAFKTIMKACLVDGYAGKPAAGWELINEGPAFLVLRNGSHSGYVCFTRYSNAMRVYLAETYTGMNGDVIAGAGVKSGNRAGSSVPQSVDIIYSQGYSTSTTWVIVADEKTAVVVTNGHTGSANVELNQLQYNTASWTLCIGEDTSGNFICAGGAASDSPGSGWSALAYGGGFTSLKDPATGLLVGSGSLELYIPAAGASVSSLQAASGWAAAATTAKTAIPAATLVPIHWQVPGAWAGRLRGIALCPEVQNVTYPSIAAQYLGRVGPMYVRDANQPIDLGDDHSYFVRAGHYNSSFYLITDNPEFW